MNEYNFLTHGNKDSFDDALGPRVDISGAAAMKDVDEINGLAFELYKEAAACINLVSKLLDESAAQNGGWPRNQAICAALMIRIFKFMVVVTQLGSTGNRGEVIFALNRSIIETAVNLEFLVKTTDDRFFDRFVTQALGAERELYDQIQENIAARNGQIMPIERRMLSSIDRLCRRSGVKIEEVERKHGDWSGGIRARLQAIGKDERYAGLIRIPSHAVHGNWMDLEMHHLEYNEVSELFTPESSFSRVDERIFGPVAILVLDATIPYLLRYFSDVPETIILLRRITDVTDRIIAVGNLHEEFMNA